MMGIYCEISHNYFCNIWHKPSAMRPWEGRQEYDEGMRKGVFDYDAKRGANEIQRAVDILCSSCMNDGQEIKD